MALRVLIISILILSAILYSFYQSKSLNSQLAHNSDHILKSIPGGSFKTLEGKDLDPNILFLDETSLLVIHFWGTWCAPCERELPDLITLAKKYEGRNEIKFLFVAVNDEVIKVNKQITKLSVPSQQSVFWLLDNSNIYRDFYGTVRVPETFIFSSSKSILRKYTGPQDWLSSDLIQSFEDFIKISKNKF